MPPIRAKMLENTVDVVTFTTALGALLHYLPNVAAGIAIILGCIRIYEWARVRIFGKPPIEKEIAKEVADLGPRSFRKEKK